MESAAQVQILADAVYVSLHTHALGKGMNPLVSVCVCVCVWECIWSVFLKTTRKRILGIRRAYIGWKVVSHTHTQTHTHIFISIITQKSKPHIATKSFMLSCLCGNITFYILPFHSTF